MVGVLYFYISHGGAAATESTFFKFKPKGGVGLAHVSGPCDRSSFFHPIQKRVCIVDKYHNCLFDEYEISGMGGQGGWIFAYVEDGNETIDEIASFATVH